MEAMQGRPLRPDLPEPLELSWCVLDPSAIQASQGKDLALAAASEARARQESSARLYEKLERERDAAAAAAAVPSAMRKRAREGAEEGPLGEQVCMEGRTVGDGRGAEGGENRCSAASVDAAGGHSSPRPGGDHGADDGAAAGWVAVTDPVTGCTYYYHAESGQRQWANGGHHSQDESSQDTSSRPGGEHGAAAAGWVAATDPATGCTYYYHAESGQRQWAPQ